MMETRVQLRRRLLRIDDDVAASTQMTTSLPSALATAAMSDVVVERASAQTNASLHSRLPLHPKRHAPHTQSDRANSCMNNDNEVDDNDDGGNNSGEDDEESGEEEEDEDDGDGDESEDHNRSIGIASPRTSAMPRRSDKCELSSVVTLLFSRHDPTRSPTVCFDYPPHLNLTRTYTGYKSDTLLRVATLRAQDCRLFYKTHWERNCVKNAFAVAGVARTKKKWGGWHMAWAKHVPKTKFRLFKGAGGSGDQTQTQVFNHFPDPWVVGRKDRLMRTLASYRRRFGASYSFFPEGFTLPDQTDAFRRALQRDSDASVSPPSIWILKPPASACGRGIRVITSKDAAAIAKDKAYVVQRYIADPLLVNGVKFDLRLYVVVTSVDPLRIYLFRDGLARFCTRAYSLTTLANRFSHLTNYAVNKANDRGPCGNSDAHGDNVDPDTDTSGSKWSVTALLAHLERTGVLTDRPRLMAQIRAVVCKTLIAAEAHLTPLVHQCVSPRLRCYELFGFDILLDRALTPWLIEVNVSPSLMGASPLDKRIKGRLLSDMFHLVGVPVAVDQLPVTRTTPRDGAEPAKEPTARRATGATGIASSPSSLSSSHSSTSSSSTSTRSSSASLLSQQQPPHHVPAAPVALHRRPSAGTAPPPMSSSSSSASSSSATAKATTAATTRRTSARAVNKQLHEVVLDPSVAVFAPHHVALFAPSDWTMIHDMEDEMDRLGHFDRIYPSAEAPDETATYAPFFTCPRYANALCAKWLQTKAHMQKQQKQMQHRRKDSSLQQQQQQQSAKQVGKHRSSVGTNNR